MTVVFEDEQPRSVRVPLSWPRPPPVPSNLRYPSSGRGSQIPVSGSSHFGLAAISGCHQFHLLGT